MIQIKNITRHLLEGISSFDSDLEPGQVFQNLYQQSEQKFLFESKDISEVYGRLSLIGLDPVLKLTGKNNHFQIEVLNERGQKFFGALNSEDFQICDDYKFAGDTISGTVKNSNEPIEETKKSHKHNIAQIIRVLLNKFGLKQRSMLGLYGAFSYDFVRLFEPLPDLAPDSETNDFNLFLFDTFVFFDHLKGKAELIVYRETTQAIEATIAALTESIQQQPETEPPQYQISNSQFRHTQSEYEQMVEAAREHAKQGDTFQIVLSNKLEADFSGDPFGLYLQYREANPSPYLFYFDFGNEQLVGASPEMMVRVENRLANLRPIAGTAKRGPDPIADHENMTELLTNPKERAELDMLIDLGRNDLSRVCKPGVKIKDYRYIEKYAKVMHTVAHVTGELKDDAIAFDALIASLNAGTLTGAPKVKAMEIIEQQENQRREYYGGCIGYLTFSGELDTAIIIRTAHIKNQQLTFQVGAGLLYNSEPAKEYQETINKAQAFLQLANPQTNA